MSWVIVYILEFFSTATPHALFSKSSGGRTFAPYRLNDTNMTVTHPQIPDIAQFRHFVREYSWVIESKQAKLTHSNTFHTPPSPPPTPPRPTPPPPHPPPTPPPTP